MYSSKNFHKLLPVTLFSSFSELFNFGRIVFETRAVVCALACILCVLHVIIACRKWREKQNCVFRGQLNNEPANSLRQLIHDGRGKYRLIKIVISTGHYIFRT